jgi:hypothetical protein
MSSLPDASSTVLSTVPSASLSVGLDVPRWSARIFQRENAAPEG